MGGVSGTEQSEVLHIVMKVVDLADENRSTRMQHGDWGWGGGENTVFNKRIEQYELI